MVRGPRGRIHCVRSCSYGEIRPRARAGDAQRRDIAMTVDQAVTKALALIEARDYVSFAELDREVPCGRGFCAVAQGRARPGCAPTSVIFTRWCWSRTKLFRLPRPARPPGPPRRRRWWNTNLVDLRELLRSPGRPIAARSRVLAGARRCRLCHFSIEDAIDPALSAIWCDRAPN
jgi:hypothetical protein